VTAATNWPATLARPARLTGNDALGDDYACRTRIGAPILAWQLNHFRTYQGYGGITQEENTTNGNYNGFQTGLRLQNKWGLSGELDYTWSHEIDIHQLRPH
jgi:hypothetical protein